MKHDHLFSLVYFGHFRRKGGEYFENHLFVHYFLQLSSVSRSFLYIFCPTAVFPIAFCGCFMLPLQDFAAGDCRGPNRKLRVVCNHTRSWIVRKKSL